MESSGPTTKSSDLHSYRWAEFMGTVIALLTLTLPLFVIANYSSSSMGVWQETNYPLTRSQK